MNGRERLMLNVMRYYEARQHMNHLKALEATSERLTEQGRILVNISREIERDRAGFEELFAELLHCAGVTKC